MIPVDLQEGSFVELFKQPSINWLGKKWWFYGISAVMFAIGAISYVVQGGLNYGIDFTGGTIVFIKFQNAPDLDLLRDTLTTPDAAPPLIQRFGSTADNTVQVRLQRLLEGGQAVAAERERLIAALEEGFGPGAAAGDRVDFNNAGVSQIADYLIQRDPDGLKAQEKSTLELDGHYRQAAEKLLDYRNKEADGLVGFLDELGRSGVSTAVVASLKQGFHAGAFAIKGLESIGAVVGGDLRKRATLAVLLALGAMLIYIAFRFKPIYGVAAILALVHDVVITLGLFALTQKEISLTVIAALLTLVGYSVNDTIVIFDRVRENVRLMPKEPLSDILNLSINQTLSRTIMTSGFTFIAVFSLFLFGGEVLNGFSFALTVGIIAGSYSTIALASTVVDWWYRRFGQKTGRKTA